jgi:hypothetical protein
MYAERNLFQNYGVKLATEPEHSTESPTNLVIARNAKEQVLHDGKNCDMIPISEEDQSKFEECDVFAYEADDGTTTNALYRIAKAAIEFNKTAVPVFHIAEEDRVLAEGFVDMWLHQDGSATNAACRIAKAALEVSRTVNNNVPKLTDINWSGLCDEKVWEDMLATGHLGAKTRGRTIAAEFQKCRDFAFSRPVVASVDDGEVKRLRQQIDNHNRDRHNYQRRIESLSVQVGDCQHEIDSLKAELATLKEQANKPRVIRRF